MRKILAIALVLFTVTVSAQRNWAVELGVGNHTIADECADLRDNLYHLDGVVRYSFNEKFGVGVYGGYDRLSLENYLTEEEFNTNYFRATLEGVADVTEITNLGNNTFTLLAHGGVGATYFSVDNGYSNVLPNLSGGLTGLFKLTQSLALKADYSTTAHFNQGNTLNGEHAVTNVGINSFVNNATVGLVVYFGKKKGNSGEHYDWYEEPKVDELAGIRRKIQDLHQALIEKKDKKEVIIMEQPTCNCLYNEYVYFDFDKYNVHRSELAAIESGMEKAGDTERIKLVGYACPRFGTVEYNIDLAKKRVEEVKAIMIEAGFDESRIDTEVIGKDYTRDSDLSEVRAMARRVDIIVGEK